MQVRDFVRQFIRKTAASPGLNAGGAVSPPQLDIQLDDSVGLPQPPTLQSQFPPAQLRMPVPVPMQSNNRFISNQHATRMVNQNAASRGAVAGAPRGPRAATPLQPGPSPAPAAAAQPALPGPQRPLAQFGKRGALNPREFAARLVRRRLTPTK